MEAACGFCGGADGDGGRVGVGDGDGGRLLNVGR